MLLMDLDQKDLLLKGTERQIYAMAEIALIRKQREEDPEETSPDSQEASEAATVWAVSLEEAQEMMTEREVTPERLEKLAEMIGPVTERAVVMSFG